MNNDNITQAAAKIEEAKRKLSVALTSVDEVYRDSAIHQALAALNSIAANKAAEEGGLPPCPDLPREAAWFDNERMHFEFGEPEFRVNYYVLGQMLDYARAYARQAIAADRASRQVANKAEHDVLIERASTCSNIGGMTHFDATMGEAKIVEKFVANKAEVGPDTQAHAIFPPEFPAFNAHGLEGNMPPDELWDYACLVGYRCATPPATTGASTASRFGNVWNDALEEAALICDQQSSEPECPERASHCADEIRALKGSVGASTVLTDERKPLGYARFRAAQRITTDGDVDANEWYEFCEPHDIGDDKLPAFPVYDEPVREVAAQAGQVAVPEGWKLVPIQPTEKMVCFGIEAYQGKCEETYAAMVAAAPSPAKESK